MRLSRKNELLRENCILSTILHFQNFSSLLVSCFLRKLVTITIFELGRSDKPTSPAFQVIKNQWPEVPSSQVSSAGLEELPGPHNTADLNGVAADVEVAAAVEPGGPKTTHNDPVFAIN